MGDFAKTGRRLDAQWQRLPLEGFIDLRGDDGAMRAFARVLGFEGELRPNRVQRGVDVDVLWMGPSHWLVRVPLSRERSVTEMLVAASRGLPAAVTVVSDAYGGFRLTGGAVDAVLAQGVSVDLEALIAGTCAQTLLARAPVLIVRLVDRRGYDVFVECSHAGYVELWLEAAVQ